MGPDGRLGKMESIDREYDLELSTMQQAVDSFDGGVDLHFQS